MNTGVLFLIGIAVGFAVVQLSVELRERREARKRKENWPHALYLALVCVCENRLKLEPCDAIREANDIVREVERELRTL